MILTPFEKGLVAHLVADWILQNDWMALNKTKLWHPAGYVHAGIHALCLGLALGPLAGARDLADLPARLNAGDVEANAAVDRAWDWGGEYARHVDAIRQHIKLLREQWAERARELRKDFKERRDELSDKMPDRQELYDTCLNVILSSDLATAMKSTTAIVRAPKCSFALITVIPVSMSSAIQTVI